MEISSIKSIKDKYKDSLPDRILERGIVIFVEVSYLPVEDLGGESIMVKDETGTLEASSKNSLYPALYKALMTNEKLNLKGYITKTEFENLSFGIEEIIG